MRRLKHKHTRRAVQFYEINYGFRKPFKVILDGNFVHALRQTSLGDPAEVLAKLLGGPVKCYVPRCVLLELKGLGTEFSETHGAARKAGLHLACGHDDAALTPTECILSNIGEANAQHYFVATQDRALRAALGRVPGGASIFMNVNGVHLEQPSEQQRRSTEQVDQQNLAMTQHERASKAMKDLPQLARKPREKSIFRLNKAKGPNPLAVQRKKKQKQGDALLQQQQHQAEHAAAEKPKKKRARARRTGDIAADTQAQAAGDDGIVPALV